MLEEKKCFVFYPNVWITPYMAFASNWAWQAMILFIRLLFCGTKQSTLQLVNPEEDDKTFIIKDCGEIVGHDNNNDYGSELTQHNM